MKILNGAELRDFIKERQAKQVRALRQSWKVFPKLLIIYSHDSPVINTYMRLKKQYAEDILIDVECRKVSVEELRNEIRKGNADDKIHGIIVQLPFENEDDEKLCGDELDSFLAEISPEKDVDGLASEVYDPATAVAINWLLAGYNIELSNRKIAIVGQGILVGKPLSKMWKNSGYDVTVFDENSSEEMKQTLNQFDIVVSAAGVVGLISEEMLKKGAVVVDAGTSSEGGVIKGDVSESVRENRKDITITPKIGGVGPLTVAALIDNVIISARKVAEKSGQKDL